MKKIITITGIAILWVVVVFFLGVLSSGATADGRPVQVQETETSLRRNQARITELKPLYEEYNKLKEDNARLVGRLEVFGFGFDWQTLQTVKTGEPSPL